MNAETEDELTTLRREVQDLRQEVEKLRPLTSERLWARFLDFREASLQCEAQSK